MFTRRFQNDVVDSTSECAFRALAEGTARHGDVHLARGQTSGRGRRGAAWESAPGEGLYLSAILLPPPPPYRPAALTVAAGLAVRDAVADAGLVRARLDWPNDVVVGEAKLAGILVETRGLDAEAPHYVVGIGVNVLQREFPAELRRERAVTSLALEGHAVEIDALAACLLTRLQNRLATIPGEQTSLAADYLAATGLCGRRVRVRRGASEEHTGELIGLDFETGILLAPDTGGAPVSIAIETVDGVDPA